jgi:hypothetical protein
VLTMGDLLKEVTMSLSFFCNYWWSSIKVGLFDSDMQLGLAQN